jgi:DNA-directed RNA polymerase specialized sigma24 family protein
MRHGQQPPDHDAIELIRRAIRDHDQDAWASLLSLYRPVVLASLRRHAASTVASEGEDYWVNRAFERFWSAITADRLDQFPSLGSLLRYLQLCAHSVILDELRARRRAPCASLNEAAEDLAAPLGAEDAVLDRLSAGELWRTITAEARDEPERLVAYLSLVRDLKPGQIHTLHPEHFASPVDVYRVKRNLLERLRRHPGVLKFLG